MAGSSRPSPLTPPLGTFGITARTPGPLGVNDQADPGVTTWLGDTPGSLGRWDWADPTLPLCTPADPYPDRICRAHARVPLSPGFDASRRAPEPAPATRATASISVKEAQDNALKITSVFEGGKVANYQALADDFDGQGMSFGLIQWNFGRNTLGPILKKMLDKDPRAFANCFGEDTDYDTLKNALIAGDTVTELKWARAMETPTNRAAWQTAFHKVGANATFQAIQYEEAVGKYHRAALTVIADIRLISPKLFKKVEFRSYAAIYDLCVQQGGLHEKAGGHKTLDAIKKRVDEENPATQRDLMIIVVTARAETAARAESITDCLSRRLGILDGAARKATATDGKIKERKNPQGFALIQQFGTRYVENL